MAGRDVHTPLSERSASSVGEPHNLILQAFAPHVAVVASEDTDALVKGKGFERGLWQLLRPFGDIVLGKVTIRDSNGSSRSWEDFSIRFIRTGEIGENPEPANTSRPGKTAPGNTLANTEISKSRLRDADAVVERHLQYAEDSLLVARRPDALAGQLPGSNSSSPYYSLYLRRILSGIPLAPHTTFSHPVACVIAISSRNEAPIEELRRLYNETSQGCHKFPAWVDGEYLRYYVLVHDEENDDIKRSLSLFEQMKRHLGLHCHLLRLRSSQCAETDDDGEVLPESAWLTAAEELEAIRRGEAEDDFVHTPSYVFESDITAIRSFVREMVTQSIIPTMERHVALWNENVASRRRGIAGRLVTFSKKWAGFGTTSRASGQFAPNLSNGYDTLGFYRPETPEATMRKLADFAFMLRDYKLAHSTYDLVKSDFHEAKAWKYHAAASEMAAISLLVTPKHLVYKSRVEATDQTLDAAFYSYHARCNDPLGALRCVMLSMELLRLRGGSSIDEAARWGVRLIESKIPGRVADALLKERVAVCYSSKRGIGSHSWGQRRRKAALWSILSAEAWVAQGKYIQAQRCLDLAQTVYSGEIPEGQIHKFSFASDFMGNLQEHLAQHLEPPHPTNLESGVDYSTPVVDEESEALDVPVRRPRAGTLTSATAGAANLETAPLRDAMGSDTVENGPAQDAFD